MNKKDMNKKDMNKKDMNKKDMKKRVLYTILRVLVIVFVLGAFAESFGRSIKGQPEIFLKMIL